MTFNLRLQLFRCNPLARKHTFWGLLVLLPSLLLVVPKAKTAASPTEKSVQLVQTVTPAIAQESWEQRGRVYYEAGQFQLAVQAWQQAAQDYAAQRDQLSQARTLSNLSLAYQQLGHWTQAKQSSQASLQLIVQDTTSPPTVPHQQTLAQALNTQGSLYFGLGASEKALASWEQASQTYQQTGDRLGVVQSHINQAKALRSLGYNRRALTLLTQLQQDLQNQSPSDLQVVVLLELGANLRASGNLDRAHETLQQSLAIAQFLRDSETTGRALFHLGKIARTQGNFLAAFTYWQEALANPISPQLKTQIQLEELQLLIQQQQWTKAAVLQTQLQTQLDTLPLSRHTIFYRLHLAHNLIKLQEVTDATFTPPPTWKTIGQFLAETVRHSQALGDQRAESLALGSLGNLYERTHQWAIAQTLTEQAIQIAETLDAPDILYRWQWQMGRILQGEMADQHSITAYDRDSTSRAIAAYREAVQHLQFLRTDIAAAESEIQFSFQEGVEPIYRGLIRLLLQDTDGDPINPEYVLEARNLIEKLRLAELDNFLREACLEATPQKIDQVDPHAAVLYPILLGDRLDIILSLPRQPLRHYSIKVSQAEVERTIDKFQKGLVIRSKRDYLTPSQKLYDWLIRPVIGDIDGQNIQNLVFVLDGSLRNIPMAALHDKQHFLIEHFNVALTPGLYLLDAKPLEQTSPKVLAAGLTEKRFGFAPLEHVDREIQAITSFAKGTTLLNETFTVPSLEQKLQNDSFPVVHIATHGKFSSQQQNTFLLAWDQKISVFDLERILHQGDRRSRTPIELLVLSACETATGDKRAALGLAGIAVRAGARSTLASLWAVSDDSTALLMSRFYEHKAQQKQTTTVSISSATTKAAALRQAQLTLIQNPLYKHPFYWSPFVLVGNWL